MLHWGFFKVWFSVFIFKSISIISAVVEYPLQNFIPVIGIIDDKIQLTAASGFSPVCNSEESRNHSIAAP